MTFDQLKQQVLDYCNLTSHEAQARVGKALNRHHRRVTSQLGLDVTRFVIRSQTTTAGVQTVTFADLEKIDRVLDTTDSTAIRLLEEVSQHRLRTDQPGTGPPARWAVQLAAADSVTVRLDTIPQDTYSLQADGWTTLTDLVGNDAPAFPESFHDILAWSVIAEELLKKEKHQLALAYEQKAEKLLADLRFQIADSPTKDTRQRADLSRAGGGAAGGGGGSVGGTAYTQTALLTFDRGPGVAPFAVAQPTAALVDYLDADKVDGLHASEIADAAAATVEASLLPIDLASEVTGRVALANLPTASPGTLLGRGSGSGGDLEPLTVSGNLSISGTVLTGNETLPAGSASEVQFRDGGVLGADAAFQYNKATDRLTVSLLDLAAAGGGQIAFPTTQNPSSGATTLDDYREGTWTPTITAPSGSGQVYTVQHGRYIKIGKQVFIYGRVITSSLGTATGEASLGGLPFTVENVLGFYAGVIQVGFWGSLATPFVYLTALVVNNTTRADLYGATGAATALSPLFIANLSHVPDLIFSGTYLASA